jgi:hypothetical protein
MYVYQPREPRRKVEFQLATPQLPIVKMEKKNAAASQDPRAARVKGLSA